MKKAALVARCVLCVLCVLGGAGCSARVGANAATTPYDTVIAPYVDAHRFMGAALVARGDQIVFSKGFGSANLEWNVPNTPSTKFRLGSITKQFTAASILLLEERGKLKIDDPVKTYLPDAPAAWDRITIHHLLTHTSGIPNFTSFQTYRTMEPFAMTPEKIVATFSDKPLDFAPGDKFSYSNSGYVLLGYLIEKITGGSYESFVYQNLLAPAGMKDSGYDSNASIIERRAAGYASGPNGFANAGFIHMSIPHAAGALYSTAEDLLRWQEALYGGKILSAASLKKMTTPFKNDYALGVYVRTDNGRRSIGHNGGIEGFNTAVAYYPDTKTSVVVLSNVNGAAPDELVGKLGRIAHGDAIPAATEHKQTTVARTTLASYVGTYEMSSSFKIAITLDGDQLFEQPSGQARLPIYPESDTKFFLKTIDAQLEFERGASGQVSGVVLNQNGRAVHGRRVAAEVKTQ